VHRASPTAFADGVHGVAGADDARGRRNAKRMPRKSAARETRRRISSVRARPLPRAFDWMDY
jgi:hypothetical protein